MKKDPYIWGIIYFDTEDKRIFVPKKNPYTGITINFANPWAYFILFLFVILVRLVALLCS